MCSAEGAREQPQPTPWVTTLHLCYSSSGGESSTSHVTEDSGSPASHFVPGAFSQR